MEINQFLGNGIECMVCGILGEEDISLLLTSAIYHSSPKCLSTQGNLIGHSW